MGKAGQTIPDEPTIPDAATRTLRAKLIMEEALETIEALGVEMSVSLSDDSGRQMELNPWKPTDLKPTFRDSMMRPTDLVEVADGVCDISVVAIGTLLACGIDPEPCQDAVDQSNLDKFKGDYRIREDGKLIKPSDWEAPDIEGELERQKL